MKRAVILGALVFCVGATLLVVWAMQGDPWTRAVRSDRAPVGEAERAPETGPGGPGSAPADRDEDVEEGDGADSGVVDLVDPDDPQAQAEKLNQLRPPPGVVVGKVVVKGNPVPAGVLVALEGKEGRPLTAQTDDEGRFRFDGVPPGNYELVVEHDRFAPRRIGFHLKEEHGAGPFEVALRPPAPPPGIVAGMVSRVDDGTPLPQAKLSLRLESRSPG
ncbi:MAG: carboxypeptidase-like regulatory domain-containing protein, partial [Planctomycetota bacterium]